MKFKKILPFIIIIAAGRVPLYGSGYGTVGAQILNLNSSSRSGAMGYAMGAVSGDVNSVVYNPAALQGIKGISAQVSHLVYFLDSKMSSISYGQKFGDIGAGAKIKIFSAQDTERDGQGEKVGDFDIRFTQLSMGAGMPLNDRLSAGAAIKYISEIYDVSDSLSASAAALDLGLWLKGFDGDSFGLILKNLGPEMKVGREKVSLDRKAALAGAHDLRGYLFVWEISTSRQYSVGFQAGLELDVMRYLKFRAGGTYITRPNFMVGIGIPWEPSMFSLWSLGSTHKPPLWELDYAFFPHMDMGMTHRFSLGVSFF